MSLETRIEAEGARLLAFWQREYMKVKHELSLTTAVTEQLHEERQVFVEKIQLMAARIAELEAKLEQPDLLEKAAKEAREIIQAEVVARDP